MGLILKFTAGFAAAGLVISLAFGFIGGNRPGNVILTALICTIVSGAIGAGVCRFLETRVPEIFAAFQPSPQQHSELREEEYGSEDVPTPMGAPETEVTADDTIPTGTGSLSAGIPSAGSPSSASGGGGATVFGDHIVVNKIKIKNEPKLIAAAIRTLLAKDEK